MSTIPWLDPKDLKFPSTDTALDEPNGLLAVGGDLSLERLISAYRLGVFPWYEDPQPILWWSPSPRAVLYPDKIHLSKSLKKRLKKCEYEITCDQAFEQVIRHCGNVPRSDQGGTWITNDMLQAYKRLHDHGVAHSLEAWHDQKLVGGLYGVSLGRIFFGESMFSLRTDASKVALAHLAKQLDHWEYSLIDCQVSNPHLLSMGAEEIERATFSQHLSENNDIHTSYNWAGIWDYRNPIEG